MLSWARHFGYDLSPCPSQRWGLFLRRRHMSAHYADASQSTPGPLGSGVTEVVMGGGRRQVDEQVGGDAGPCCGRPHHERYWRRAVGHSNLLHEKVPMGGYTVQWSRQGGIVC